MTVIIGYIEPETNTVFMGSDSRSTQKTYIDTLKESKVWINDEFIIGVCGDLRLLNVIKYQFKPPKHPKDMLTEKYMNSLFINEIQGTLVGMNVKDDDEENKDRMPGQILVGYKGRLFKIGVDFGVHESTMAFRCIGSAEQFALGALLGSIHSSSSIENKIYNALEVASHFDAAVGPPFYVLKL
jgi:hypothetical protein